MSTGPKRQLQHVAAAASTLPPSFFMPPVPFREVRPGVWEPEGYIQSDWELSPPDIPDIEASNAEYCRCSQDLARFAFLHCWTLDVDDPSGAPQWRKFPCYAYLRRFFDGVQVPTNVHVEKSRQMLMSWAWMIVFLWDIQFHENWGDMALSRRQDEVEGIDTPDSLLGKIKAVWDSLPPYLTEPLEFKATMVRNPKTNSFVRGETGTVRAGRGRANKRALMDEAAYITKGESIFKGLRQAAKNGTCLSSTPNGKGDVFARIRFSTTTTFKKFSFHWSEHPRKAEGLYCTCGWQAPYPGKALEYFLVHACGNPAQGKPPEMRSTWYDRECQDLTPEGVASELDISYEKSRRGRVFAAFDVTRHVVEAQTYVGERGAQERLDAYRERYLRAAIQPYLPCVVGWDFGVDDPTSLVLGQVVDESRMRIRWLDEYEKNNASWDHFHGFVNGLWAPLVRELTGVDLLHYGDPAGKQRESDLMSWVSNLRGREPGIVVIHGPKRGSELEWIDFVHNTVRKGDFEIASWCSHFIDAISNYHWPVDTEGNPVPGKHMPVHDENSHCFVAHTPVETLAGMVPIECVIKGDLVATRQGWKRVVSAGLTRVMAQVVMVRLSDGRTLTGTPDHRVWTENRGWTPMCALRDDDVLADSRRAHEPAVRVVGIEPVGRANVYDLTVEDAPEFFANGILVHNCMSAMRYVYQFRWWQKLPDIDSRAVGARAILRSEGQRPPDEGPGDLRDVAMRPIDNPKPERMPRLKYF